MGRPPRVRYLCLVRAQRATHRSRFGRELARSAIAENRDTDGHRTPHPQLVTNALLRAELAELESRMVDRIGALETRLDHKFAKMNGRLWFAFSILAALIVGFDIFG